MKKLVITLVLGFILFQSISAISNIRLWQCRPSEQPNRNCTQAEQKTVQEWFANAKIDALKTLAADLTNRGIAVTTSQLQKEQALVEPELSDDIRQKSEQFKEVQRKIEDVQRQQQKVTRSITSY